MAWGKEWASEPVTIFKDMTKEEYEAKYGKLDCWPDAEPAITKAIAATGKALIDIFLPTKKEYNNKVPTHDPYTNPNSHIYYECSCGDILDPGTKSFASLNNAAMNAGWKVRWGEQHYVPYCVKCGEGVE